MTELVNDAAMESFIDTENFSTDIDESDAVNDLHTFTESDEECVLAFDQLPAGELGSHSSTHTMDTATCQTTSKASDSNGKRKRTKGVRKLKRVPQASEADNGVEKSKFLSIAKEYQRYCR